MATTDNSGTSAQGVITEAQRLRWDDPESGVVLAFTEFQSGRGGRSGAGEDSPVVRIYNKLSRICLKT